MHLNFHALSKSPSAKDDVCIKSWPTVLETCFRLCQPVKSCLENSKISMNRMRKFNSNKSELLGIGWLPQTTTCPYTSASTSWTQTASKDVDRNNLQTLLGLTLFLNSSSSLQSCHSWCWWRNSGTVRKRIFGINCKMIVLKRQIDFYSL
jgi:hypothetical protein